MAQPPTEHPTAQQMQSSLLSGSASVRVANVVVRMDHEVHKDNGNAQGAAAAAAPADPPRRPSKEGEKDKQSAAGAATGRFASDVIYVTSEDLMLYGSEDEDQGEGPVHIPTIKLQ